MANNLVALRAEDMSSSKARLLDIVREKSLSVGKVRLASGKISDYYFDMKPALLDPEGATIAADLILEKIHEYQADYVGGLEVGALLAVIAVVTRSRETARPIAGCFVRKAVKEHGTQKLIEGNWHPGARVIVLDDVTTTGLSVLQAVHALRAKECIVEMVVTVVDREEGALENLAREGIELRPILKTSDFKP